MEPSREQQRVSRSASFTLAATRSVVFPLFGPDREGDWAADWNPEPVYPPYIAAEERAVFKTYHSEEAIWVMTRLVPEEGMVQYTTFRANDRVGQITVRVSEAGSGSHVEVTYTFTALSDRGRKHIAHFTERHYREMIAEWEGAISHFLETGQTLQG
ncbi:MAG: hypothetical protein ABI670_16460 [Chloroflexota bacterium]